MVQYARRVFESTHETGSTPYRGNAISHTARQQATGIRTLWRGNRPPAVSRYECQLIDAPARDSGISVIAPDRPGYGLTQPRHDQSLCAWTSDIAALADHLRIDRFCVVGVSGGGPCALACAHEMPERVMTAGLVASLGPVYEESLRTAMNWPSRVAFYLANNAPSLFKLVVGQPAMQLARIRPELLIRMLAAINGGPDKRILLEPPILRAFTFSIQACFQQGALGSMQDLRIFRQPWGIEFGDIRQPVYLWHGDLDKVVPLDHSRHLHRHLPHSKFDTVFHRQINPFFIHHRSTYVMLGS